MKNIVFITALKSPTNELRSEGYKYSIDSWKVWCRANKCDLRVLDEPLFDYNQMKPNFSRYYCFELLKDEEFDQICLVDADTIIHPNCPNFFELTDHQFCAVHNDGEYDWLCRSVENYEYEFFGTDKVKQEHIWNYFNTGFLITNKKFKFIFDELLDFYWNNQSKVQSMQQKYGVGTDQPLLNMIIRHSDDVKVKLLPYIFNMQDLQRKNILDERMLFTEIEGVYHLNAVDGGPECVNYWLERIFREIYK